MRFKFSPGYALRYIFSKNDIFQFYLFVFIPFNRRYNLLFIGYKIIPMQYLYTHIHRLTAGKTYWYEKRPSNVFDSS